MTDATDAVTIDPDFSSVSPLPNQLLRSGAKQAEVSPPNSLYSLCGGSKTRKQAEKKKEKQATSTNTVH